MEDNNDEFEGDHLTSATTFSQLLFGDDDVDVDHLHGYSSLWFNTSPTMLCFGDHPNGVGAGQLLISDYQNGAVTPPKSVVTSCESSSASSSCTVNKSNNQKRSGSAKEAVGCTDSVAAAAGGGRRQPKKTKAENPGSAGHAKRKEKLGERISALQQLVSPFGKTDTASVLHEAMGYIRFLHDQVQVLCSPYMQVGLPSPHCHRHQPGNGDNKREEARRDLRSRGLCLIPVESTVHVVSSNGADFWSPAMANNRSNVPSSTRH